MAKKKSKIIKMKSAILHARMLAGERWIDADLAKPEKQSAPVDDTLMYLRKLMLEDERKNPC